MASTTVHKTRQALRTLRFVPRSTRQRPSSTCTAPAITKTAPSSIPPPPPPPRPRSFLYRYRRALIWSTIGLTLGGMLGTLVSQTIAPPPYPSPGSHEDALLLHDLEARIDAEFKVKVLRGKCAAAAANLRGEEGVWKEVPAGLAKGSFMEKGMGGARGLGVERVFWNEKEKELVAVVWFGGAMSGWPGVAHGGGIATVVGEKMSLAAQLAKAGFGSIGTGGLNVEEPDQLELTYKKPTMANAFYVVRAFPRYGEEYQGVFASGSKDEVEVDAQLETLEGTVCVQVRGSVPSAGISGSSQASRPSLSSTKSWVGWPSRSQT